jgi:hypothetical protein
MRIEFSRSGGITGIRLTLTLDTATLPSEEAGLLEDCVNRSGFFELPEILPSGGADRVQYKLTIERDGTSHSVQMDDGAIPEALSTLIKRLEAASRARPAMQ